MVPSGPAPFGGPPGAGPGGRPPFAGPPGAGPPFGKPPLGRRLKSWLAKNRGRIVLAILVGLGYGANRIHEARSPYEWTGSIECRSVALGSRVGGRVKEVFVKEGQSVKAGTAVLALEASELQSQLAVAQAEVEAAQAVLEKLRNGALREEVAGGHARAEEARAAAAREVERAAFEKKEQQRAQALFNAGAISKADLDQKVSSARAAAEAASESAALARAAEANLTLLTKGSRAEDIRVAQAAVKMAKAKVSLVTEQLDELVVRTVHDGRVESITVRAGDTLEPSATAATVLETDQLFATIYIPEPHLGKVHVGQELPLVVDAFPKRLFKARLEHINNAGEFTPRNLATADDRADQMFGSRFGLLEGQEQLRVGMSVAVRLPKRR